MQTSSAKQEACIKSKFPSFKNAIEKKQEQKQEGQKEKILNEVSIPKECENKPKPISIQSKQSQFVIDPKMQQIIDQGQKYKDQFYMQKVLEYESDEGRAFQLSYWPYRFGKKVVKLEIGFFNYLLCKVEEGEQCELCYSNDPVLKWLYMIRSGSKIHFMHPFCVYNSNGFTTVDKSTTYQIDNLEWMMENIKDKKCHLCNRPNASLQCAGKDKNNQPCPINYHACCLYNRKDLGEVRITPDGPLIFCSRCKQHKKKPTKILEPYSKPINKLTKTDNQDLIEEPIFNGVGEMAIKRLLSQQEVKRTLNEVKDEKLLEYFGCMTEYSLLFGSDIAKSLNSTIVKLLSQE